MVIDDRLLIEELLVGLLRGRRPSRIYTTSYWYYRACRAAVAGAGGHLSGAFERLPLDQQARAILSLLELPDDIGLPDPRMTIPVMARLSTRHTRLNVLNLEAAAAADVLDAQVWLSPQGAAGVLPGVLDAEGVPWRTVDPPSPGSSS